MIWKAMQVKQKEKGREKGRGIWKDKLLLSRKRCSWKQMNRKTKDIGRKRKQWHNHWGAARQPHLSAGVKFEGTCTGRSVISSLVTSGALAQESSVRHRDPFQALDVLFPFTWSVLNAEGRKNHLNQAPILWPPTRVPRWWLACLLVTPLSWRQPGFTSRTAAALMGVTYNTLIAKNRAERQRNLEWPWFNF